MNNDTPVNVKQVGGLHYKNGYQHWDLVRDLRLGYFEGQITKYITRHRVKNKRQDLEKAQHFAEKLLELASKNGWVPGHSFGWNSIEQRQRYFTMNQHMTNGDRACMELAMVWRMPADVVKLIDAIKEQIEAAYPAAVPLYLAPPAPAAYQPAPTTHQYGNGVNPVHLHDDIVGYEGGPSARGYVDPDHGSD